MDRSLVTILVVDEDIMVRRVLETLIERDGFSVLSTRNAHTALQMMKAATIDLVLMDLPRRDQNNVEHTAGIRHQFPDVKVVVMSGFFGANTPPASWLRAHACLAKPIRPEILSQTVQALLCQHAIPLVTVH
jgi:DNA-binding NtrC family response regulator